MICSACNDDIARDDVRWDGDIPYCEKCFDGRYNFCSRCDAIIPRDETNYDDGGNPYCDSYWEQDFDYDAPNNPEVIQIMKLAVKVSEIITETLKEEIGEQKIRRKKNSNESKQRKIEKSG